MQEMYRQGDLLFIRTTIPAEVLGQQRPREAGRLIVAYGETTGHAHAIEDGGAELYEARGQESALERRFLKVLTEGGVAIGHEEHASLALPHGEYVVCYQRTYAPPAPEAPQVPLPASRPRWYED